MQSEATWIIAHRGASSAAPENTLAAARLAWDMGTDAVEVDLHLTRDGHVVVIHDADAWRTTGVALRIAGATLARVKALDAGSWGRWGSRGISHWRGERIPALRELIDVVPAGGRLVLELKAGEELLAPLGANLAASGFGREQVTLITFDRNLAFRARARLPQYPVFWVSDRHRGEPAPRAARTMRGLIAMAKSLAEGGDSFAPPRRMQSLDGLALAAHPAIDAAFVEEVHAAGLKLMVWTVDDPAEGERLLRAGVDGLTTNAPEVMLAVQAGLTPAASEWSDAQGNHGLEMHTNDGASEGEQAYGHSEEVAGQSEEVASQSEEVAGQSAGSITDEPGMDPGDDAANVLFEPAAEMNGHPLEEVFFESPGSSNGEMATHVTEEASILDSQPVNGEAVGRAGPGPVADEFVLEAPREEFPVPADEDVAQERPAQVPGDPAYEQGDFLSTWQPAAGAHKAPKGPGKEHLRRFVQHSPADAPYKQADDAATSGWAL